MISNGMEIIGAWMESILVEVLVFTCGTVNVLLFDIAGSSRTATSATVNVFSLKIKESMPTRGPWASRMRMRNGQEGVKIHRMRKKKQEKIPRRRSQPNTGGNLHSTRELMRVNRIERDRKHLQVLSLPR